MPKKPKIIISSCLLGNRVRFDGGHKKHAFIMHEMDEFVDWQTVCPEVAMGLGVPRSTLRLVDKGNGETDLFMPKENRSYTQEMDELSNLFVEQLNPFETHGMILKSSSPSCGLRHVKVYTKEGMPSARKSGHFAKKMLEQKYLFPVEEDGRLNDPYYRENFIYAVYAWKHWCDLKKEGLSKSKLYRFHRQHKYRLMAHSPLGLKQLGRLLAKAKPEHTDITAGIYISKFMELIKSPANAKKHANVMFHILGYFKRLLSTTEKRKIHESIEFYRQGTLPLIVPLSFLNLYAEKYEIDYLLDQKYLNPYPEKLKLMNTI